MPWSGWTPMDVRRQFVADYAADLWSMTELCAQYGVARKTGYKWVARVREDGRRGLQDRSRAPHSCPHKTGEAIAALIVAARRAHPDWGPQLLLDWLRPRHPGIRHWPAASTAGALLKREGLVLPRRRRRPTTHPGVVDPITAVPNDLWTADFKGQFRTQDRIYCYPLTIADQHTRYLLTCHGLPSVHGALARTIFERAFREYGLPLAIRTDNGAPFVTRALCGLSSLNVWWMRLGIQHQRIHPASPQENGAHERMHRTLKRDSPAARNRARPAARLRHTSPRVQRRAAPPLSWRHTAGCALHPITARVPNDVTVARLSHSLRSEARHRCGHDPLPKSTAVSGQCPRQPPRRTRGDR